MCCGYEFGGYEGAGGQDGGSCGVWWRRKGMSGLGGGEGVGGEVECGGVGRGLFEMGGGLI